MANLCSNVLIVTGSEEDIERFEEEARQEEKGEGGAWREGQIVRCKKEEIELIEYCKNNNRPLPEAKFMPRAWIDEENKLGLKNWGIAHEIFLCDEVEHTKEAGKLIYKFDTKWEPPIKWLETASGLFPELALELKYYEISYGFQGIALATGGVVTDDRRDYFVEGYH